MAKRSKHSTIGNIDMRDGDSFDFMHFSETGYSNMIYVLYLVPKDTGVLDIKEEQGEIPIEITTSATKIQILTVLILDGGSDIYISVGGVNGGGAHCQDLSYIAWHADSSGDLSVSGDYWAFN